MRFPKIMMTVFVLMTILIIGSCICDESNAATVEDSTYTVKIPEGVNLWELVKAGNYPVKADVIGNGFYFPQPVQSGTIDITVVHFEQRMNTDNVLEELAKENKRPATIIELAALGKDYPELQTTFKIVELKTAIHYTDYRLVGVLCMSHGERGFFLEPDHRGWGQGIRFATVEISSN